MRPNELPHSWGKPCKMHPGCARQPERCRAAAGAALHWNAHRSPLPTTEVPSRSQKLPVQEAMQSASIDRLNERLLHPATLKATAR